MKPKKIFQRTTIKDLTPPSATSGITGKHESMKCGYTRRRSEKRPASSPPSEMITMLDRSELI